MSKKINKKIIIMTFVLFLFLSNLFSMDRRAIERQRVQRARKQRTLKKIRAMFPYFVSKGQVGGVKKFINKKNVNTKYESVGDSLLHYACRSNNIKKEIIEYLVNIGAKVNYENKLGQTPMSIACFSKDLHLIKLLVNNGAGESIIKPNNRKMARQKGITPFHLACRHQGYDVIVFLMDNGAKKIVNQPMKNGDTPFIVACRHQQDKKTFLYFLSNGADLNSENKLKRSSLAELCTNKNISLEVVDLFLSKGADPNKLDKLQETPLHLALKNKEAELSIIESLVKAMDVEYVNKMSKKMQTPIILACRFRTPEFIKFLIENGAKESLNMQGVDKKTPLHLAIEYQDSDTVKYLLDNGAIASINVEDVYGKTPIYYIASFTDNGKEILIFIFLKLLGLEKKYSKIVEVLVGQIIAIMKGGPLEIQEYLKEFNDQRIASLKQQVFIFFKRSQQQESE